MKSWVIVSAFLFSVLVRAADPCVQGIQSSAPATPEVRTLAQRVLLIAGKANFEVLFGDHQDEDQSYDLGVGAGFVKRKTRFGENPLMTIRYAYIEDSNRFSGAVVNHVYGVFCLGKDGSLSPVPKFSRSCPAQSRYALDLSLARAVLDMSAERKHDGVRWAELGLKANLYEDSPDPSLQHKRVSAEVGASVETVWPGTNLQATRDDDQYRTAPFTAVRGNLQVDGGWTSQDGLWTASGQASIRPNLANLRDYGLAIKVQGYRNFKLGPVPASIGVTADFTQWPYPERSLDQDQSQGPLFEDDERRQVDARGVFQLHWR